jgi:hypothetical protein
MLKIGIRSYNDIHNVCRNMLCTHPLTLAENVIRIDYVITKSNLAKVDHGHITSEVN